MSPTEFLAEPDVVALDLQAFSGEEAVRALHARLTDPSRAAGASGAPPGSSAIRVGAAITDAPGFLTDVLGRMRLASVCLAEDIALPHARTDAVARMVLAVGRVRSGVAFDAEHPAVRLVFLIGTPRRDVGEYLKVVAALSRLLRQPAVRSGLLAARDEAEFRSLLAGRPVAAR